MYLESDRLNTFKTWPLDYIKSKVLATAGCYYRPLTVDRSKVSPSAEFKIQFVKHHLQHIGISHQIAFDTDRVQCFSCKMEMSGWERSDDTFKKHKQFNIMCHFVRLEERTQCEDVYSTFLLFRW